MRIPQLDLRCAAIALLFPSRLALSISLPFDLDRVALAFGVDYSLLLYFIMVGLVVKFVNLNKDRLVGYFDHLIEGQTIIFWVHIRWRKCVGRRRYFCAVRCADKLMYT